MSWHFDESSGQYVSMSDDPALTLGNSDWTIGGWVKLDDNTGSVAQYFLSWGTWNATPSINLFFGEESAGVRPDVLSCRVTGDNGVGRTINSSTTPGANLAWQHVILSRSGGTLEMYVNGISVGTTTAPTDAVNRSDALWFGARSDGSSDLRLGGTMAEWGKWDRALSAAEIQALAVYAIPSDFATSLAWHVKMVAADYTEEIVPITVTNNDSTAGATEPIGTIFTWEGDDSTNHATGSNWDLGSTPGTGEIAFFDAGAVDNCLVSAPWALQNLWMDSTYTEDIDLGTANLTMDGGGDVILASATGTFDMGTGTLSITDGVFDNKEVGTFTRGTSTLECSGVCTLISHTSNAFHNLTIASGATVTVSTLTTSALTTRGTLDVYGTLILEIFTQAVSSNVHLRAGADVSGNVLSLQIPGSGEGLLTFDATATLTSQFIISNSVSGSIVSSGTFGGKVKFNATSASNGIMELDATGDYVFDGGLELETTTTGSFTLANDVNEPASITVGGDFTIDLNSTGDITIDDSTTSVEWFLQGDVVDQITGGGTFTWIPGSEPITFDGMLDQQLDMDFNGATLPAIIIDKPLGFIALEGDFTTASFTGIEVHGFDPNGETINIDGDCDFAAAFDVVGGGNDWGSCVWNIGGNATFDGQDLGIGSSGPWELNVTGSAIASGAGSIENCNASGGSPLIAIGWTDGGGNTNVVFSVGVSSVLGGGILSC
jgi:hypothetical protein